MCIVTMRGSDSAKRIFSEHYFEVMAVYSREPNVQLSEREITKLKNNSVYFVH